MGGIIPLQDPHRRTQLLLPWRANGTLEPDEETSVTAHLEQCAECRDDLQFERELATGWASLVPETDSGLARVRPRTSVSPVRRRRAMRIPRKFARGHALPRRTWSTHAPSMSGSPVRHEFNRSSFEQPAS